MMIITNYNFRFVEAEYEYGFERFMHKDNMKGIGHKFTFKKHTSNIVSELAQIKNESAGIIPALEILQVGYNEMKEHLDQPGPSKGLLPATTIMEKIMAGVNQMEKNLIPAAHKEKHNALRKREMTKSDSDDESIDEIGLKRSQIKKKGFQLLGVGFKYDLNTNDKDVEERAHKSSQNSNSQPIRTTITEDENCIKITRPTVQTYSRFGKQVWWKRTVHRQLDISQ